MKFEIDYCEDNRTVELYVKECEGKHIQQVSYSTYHKALTQVCFGCKKVRTSIKKEELETSDSEGCGKPVITSRTGKDDGTNCGECRHDIDCKHYGEKEEFEDCEYSCEIIFCDECAEKEGTTPKEETQ